MKELDQLMALHQRAAGLLGLRATVATRIADERGFIIRMVTAETTVVDLAWIMSRLSLELDAHDTVIRVSLG